MNGFADWWLAIRYRWQSQRKKPLPLLLRRPKLTLVFLPPNWKRRSAAASRAVRYTSWFACLLLVFLRRSFPMSSPAITYARDNQRRFVDELKDLLRIPSVSTAEEHKGDVLKAAEMVAADLTKIGFEHVEIIPTSGHPLVYADWLHAAAKPTALCYAHYDV